MPAARVARTIGVVLPAALCVAAAMAAVLVVAAEDGGRPGARATSGDGATCPASALTLELTHEGVGLGSSYQLATLTNDGPACRAPAQPLALTAVDARGDRVHLRARPAGRDDEPPWLDAGAAVGVMFQTANLCSGPEESVPSHEYRNVTVSLDSGSVEVAGLSLTLCDDEVSTWYQRA